MEETLAIDILYRNAIHLCDEPPPGRFFHRPQRDLDQAPSDQDIPLRCVQSVGPNVPLSAMADRMAESGFTTFPVVDCQERCVGLISLRDVLKGRLRNLEAEQRRERTLHVRLPGGPAAFRKV